jgi:hypothetical protein
MLAVAEHYEHFGGVSPINAQNRALIAALVGRLQADGPPLPVYWGNRNWDPVLRDTLWRMANDGRRRALAYVTSAYSSYSGCRQYREDIARACEPLGNRAPQVDKLRAFFNHPEFIGAMVERVQEARVRLASSTPPFVFYTAHSIPMAMAEGSAYAEQPGWCPRQWDCQIIAWCIKAAAARRASPGSSPTFAMRCAISRAASPGGQCSSCRLGFCPTTWRFCTTWTWRRARCATSWASRWPAPKRLALTHGSWV